MMRQNVAIPAEELDRAYARSRATIKQLPVRTEDVVTALERLLGTYEVVMNTIQHYDAALYLGAKEARRETGAPGSAEKEREFTYPDRPGKIARGIDLTNRVLAAYCERIVKEAKKKLHDAPESVTLAGRRYTLRETVPESSMPFMVGLEEEYATLRKSLKQTFLYEPRTRTNTDGGRFPESFLLCGPPGTGKSTLLKALVTEGERCAALNGTPFRFESYDASSFSSYFGQSTRVLKKLLRTIRSPDGVGLFIIEDADMVLQSRDDQHKSHGILELQQYLMNELSGLRRGYANTITVFTTNKTDHIDEAMRSRMQSAIIINPFKHVATHEAYWGARAEHLSGNDRHALATRTHAEGLAGRDLDGVLRAATALATPEPTDEEIRARMRTRPVPNPTRKAFEHAIAARITAQRTRAS